MKAKALLSGDRTLETTSDSFASTLGVDTSSQVRASLVGTLLDQRYRVRELIGSGGMSRVYRAEHVLLGRSVAIKTLRASLSADDELIVRSLREARVIAAIDSPHVVDILDIGRLADGGLYLVLEYLEGWDLASVVKRQGALEVARSLELAMQLCDAVSAVHRAEVVHRDIKPHNVFLTSMTPACIKLLDFGICKVSGSSQSADTPAATRTGVLLGTPHYMAPEQIDRCEAGPATDIYAIGATLHFMLTGRPPFEGTSLPRLLLQICEAELTPLVGLPELTSVLECALAKRPQERFQSAAAFRHALAQCAKRQRARARTEAHA
jgi:serine/threonine-protein kinase